MCSGKTLEAYFFAGIIITLVCFASGKFNSRTTDVGQHTTDKQNELQHLTDDDTLITTLEKLPRKPSNFKRVHQSKITNVIIKNPDKKLSKWRENELRRFRGKKHSFRNRSLRKNRHSKSWFGRFIKEKGNSGKLIHRKSLVDGSTYGNNDDDDDENIRSKDEDEDEDVQLIIIPRKPRKHFRSEVRVQNEKDTNGGFQVSESTESDSENDSRVSGNPVDDSENDRKNPRIYNEEEFSDSKNFQNSGKISQKLKRVHHKQFQAKWKNTNDDATLTLERVAPEEDGDDDDSKISPQPDGGDYDLHLKVKDKSGTKVKLSGDLPGNIGNLMAVGKDGGKVELKNTGENLEESSNVLSSVKLQDGIDDATTDKLAQNLIGMKSGKFKHSPYPSTILLKPNSGINESPKLLNEDDSHQSPTLLKSPRNDESSTQGTNKLTSLTRDEADDKAERTANQQTGDNIFAPMEFENGDDEIMATSRLLDIAQKVDDVTSLKDIKDSSNTVKEPRSQSAKFLKQLTNDMEGSRTSKAFLKSETIPSEDDSKQSENIDEESNNNWYKMQSLEDRVVKEGTSARAGEDVGYYNGQEVSVVSPGQLQLLQTEYPGYPAYLTPLLRTNFTKKA